MTEGRKDGRTGRCTAALLAAGLLAVLPSFRLSAQDTLPVGYGNLTRDDIVVKFLTEELEIQVLPLDEQVIRLLAPDTYRSLEALITSKRALTDTLARQAGVLRPTLVLVTFTGIVPQARFTPEDVNLTSRGRLYRPVGIIPLLPSWNTLQLQARQQSWAIYVFEEGISVREALTISYQGLSSDAWSRAILELERERARVLARVRAQPSQ